SPDWHLCGGLPPNSSFSRRQWAPFPHFDDPSPFARGLCLCTLQLARKRNRAKQGRILPRPTSDTGDHSLREARLAALAIVPPARSPTTTAPACEKSRTRTTRRRQIARPLRKDPRLRP